MKIKKKLLSYHNKQWNKNNLLFYTLLHFIYGQLLNYLKYMLDNKKVGLEVKARWTRVKFPINILMRFYASFLLLIMNLLTSLVFKQTKIVIIYSTNARFDILVQYPRAMWRTELATIKRFYVFRGLYWLMPLLWIDNKTMIITTLPKGTKSQWPRQFEAFIIVKARPSKVDHILRISGRTLLWNNVPNIHKRQKD